MMIANCFYVTLATLIEPENYKEEFKCARKVLNHLKSIYPNFEEKQIQELLLYTYELHPYPVSMKARLEYIEILLILIDYFLEYGYYVDDYEDERQRKLQYCRVSLERRLSRYQKQFIADITYYYYMAQIKADTAYLLSTPPTITH